MYIKCKILNATSAMKAKLKVYKPVKWPILCVPTAIKKLMINPSVLCVNKTIHYS